jgi:hypothetical protein
VRTVCQAVDERLAQPRVGDDLRPFGEGQVSGHDLSADIGRLKVSVSEMEAGLTDVNARLDRIEIRQERIELRLDHVERRLWQRTP